MRFYGILLTNLCLVVHGQFYLSNVCFMTFDNASVTNDPSNPNANIFVCPSSCYTMRYLSNQQEYPIFGNGTYSGNSLICKAALHDGRVAPWNGERSTILIQNISSQSSVFESTLRNGILSAKSVGYSYLTYQFLNSRINETSIPDIAIEHRGYLYSQDQPSSITCRSKLDLNPIQQINIDNGWKHWKENRLKYFTFPRNLTRAQSLTFCTNNNGTLMYWANSTEQNILQDTLSTTIYDLFRYQRRIVNNNTLNFFIGLKQINRNKQWESDIKISLDQINITSINNNDDYCTMLQIDASNSQLFRIYDHKCNDENVSAYPLCRLLPSVMNEENDFIYRLEQDTEPRNLVGVIDFCAELGGYPIYANNAYEWQLIQEIMLKDQDFNYPYAFTGLVSDTKQVTNAYWMPRNTSYNSTLDYVWFATSRGSERTGYHLSKAFEESFYALYDANPYLSLNTLRFCRKPDIRSLMKESSCGSKACTSKCLNMTLPNESDDARFGLYSCIPKNSLVGIVYTQSFPSHGDFIRPNLPMDYSVSVRRNFAESFMLNFEQIDKNLRYSCYEYMNFDRLNTLNETISLICDSLNTNNKTMNGVRFKNNFNGLISFALQDRRMSGHHTRFIDYPISDNRCRNQGIYHPYVNQCICSPGFYGNECQYTCPSGFYGQTCDYYCSGDDDFCQGLLICLPDPYGCSCYTGWYGTHCNISCPSDRYGPDCQYQCPCPSCNRFTGVCDCNGTECYQGIYNRLQLQSKCLLSSSSSNLALIIIIPIISVTVLISIILIILYWKFLYKKKNISSYLPNDMIDEHL